MFEQIFCIYCRKIVFKTNSNVGISADDHYMVRGSMSGKALRVSLVTGRILSEAKRDFSSIMTKVDIVRRSSVPTIRPNFFTREENMRLSGLLSFLLENEAATAICTIVCLLGKPEAGLMEIFWTQLS